MKNEFDFTLTWKHVLGGTAAILLTITVVILTWMSTFYAEPSYTYHVRTVFGAEHVVTSTAGYKFFLLHRKTAWKTNMTVQSSTKDISKSQQTSANLPPMEIMFLDNVDAKAQATVRFSIPTERQTFLKMAHVYRTPENLLRTALIPSFEETLQANASLMNAEEYYGGGRTQFNAEFDSQMSKGIYIVKREEVRIETNTKRTASANAAKGSIQDSYADDGKTIFVVRKVLNEDGTPKRNPQDFSDFGIQVVSATITDIDPNRDFVQRMGLKQKASADRAIAREKRVQEEEERLLAIARGEREVAERQAKAKVEQIQRTTEAETEKQLTITNAERQQEEARIAKETAQIALEKARIEAETKRTLADAEAYQKEVVLKADNALAQKLDAEIEIQKVWATAFSQRKVPTTVFAGSGGSNIPSGSDSEAKTFMQILTLDAAKRLNYDRQINTK